MCSIIIEDIFDEIKEENKRLSEELAFIREKQKVFIQFKITFDVYSHKIKQSLESNEWQKFEILLTKLNDFSDIRKTPIINPSIDFITGLKQQKQSQKVIHMIYTIKSYKTIHYDTGAEYIKSH